MFSAPLKAQAPLVPTPAEGYSIYHTSPSNKPLLNIVIETHVHWFAKTVFSVHKQADRSHGTGHSLSHVLLYAHVELDGIISEHSAYPQNSTLAIYNLSTEAVARTPALMLCA